MAETAKLGLPSIIEILGDVEASLAGSIEHAAAASLLGRCIDALRIWAVNGWDDVTPQHAPDAAVTEAAVRDWIRHIPDAAAGLLFRQWNRHGAVTPDEVAHFCRWIDGLDAQEEWGVGVDVAEARRLLDAGESEVRG